MNTLTDADVFYVQCQVTAKKMKQIDLFPQYKQMYINAFDKMIEKRKEKGLETSWKNGTDCFDWWIERYKHEVKGQLELNFK